MAFTAQPFRHFYMVNAIAIHFAGAADIKGEPYAVVHVKMRVATGESDQDKRC